MFSSGRESNQVMNPAKAGENLARHIIRASFSQETMTYIPEEATVIYQSKDR